VAAVGTQSNSESVWRASWSCSRPTPGFAATKPGTILRTRRIALAPGTPVAGEGASAVYQLLYRTTDEHGAPSATVGTVFVPRRHTAGPRRLVPYQIAETA
jgi:triacylglycerol lipase